MWTEVVGERIVDQNIFFPKYFLDRTCLGFFSAEFLTIKTGLGKKNWAFSICRRTRQTGLGNSGYVAQAFSWGRDIWTDDPRLPSA